MTVYFIGAGPGAPDLITVRGLKLIERCPVCLYAGSLVPEEIVHAAPAMRWSWTPRRCISTRSSRRWRRPHAAGQDVARVHSGDPSIYGAVAEQMRRLDALGSTTRWCRACRPLPERRRSCDRTDAAGNRPDDDRHAHRHEGVVDARGRTARGARPIAARRSPSTCRSAISIMSAGRWSPVTVPIARW
jgi:hypothetical protein